MSMYSHRLHPALQNLLRVVRFFHPRSSCTTTHISADIQRITLNVSCMTISGGRTKQLDIFCSVTGFTSDFLSFIVVVLIPFFHESFQLFLVTQHNAVINTLLMCIFVFITHANNVVQWHEYSDRFVTMYVCGCVDVYVYVSTIK